jgi:hypothetical protein
MSQVGTHELPCKVEKGEDGKVAKVTLWRPYGDQFQIETDYAFIAAKFARPISEVQFECEGPQYRKVGGQSVKGKHLVGVPK